VPYPYATDDHQSHNAVPFVEAGAARVVRDADLDGTGFGNDLVRLLEDQDERASMSAAARSLGRPDAASAVVNVVHEVAMQSRSIGSRKGAR
jgi:UDP-N-acetylglucosamine--N-acetylmuramyl-(pentapeptide) pyrophosphoryl-undecaprenol N-acetylglucosamine transferase